MNIFAVRWPPVENLPDLLTAGHHTADFRGTRAERIGGRVHILSLLYGVLALAWIGVDLVTLAADDFWPLLVARLLLAGVFLALAAGGARSQQLGAARVRLTILVVAPVLFYLFSRIILEESADKTVLMGYSIYPFVLIVQLAVFPLAMIEGALLALPVFAGVALARYWFGPLCDWATVGEFWLLGLLLLLVLWASMSQLHMLLTLYRQATRDGLTGMLNRRAVLERLEAEMARTRRYGRPLSVMLLDLDRFKRINDTHGHLAGDEVLRRFAALVGAAIRASDQPGRYGGEEFLLFLPETPVGQAGVVAERIRQACEAARVSIADKKVGFNVSIGLAELLPDETVAELINRADEALYRAKQEGRNRVVCAD